MDDYILTKARQIFLARGPSFGAKVEAEHIVGAGNHLKPNQTSVIPCWFLLLTVKVFLIELNK